MSCDNRPREVLGIPRNLNLILFRAKSNNTDNPILILERLIELGFEISSVQNEEIIAYYNTTTMTLNIVQNKNQSFTMFINGIKEATMSPNGIIKFIRFNSKKLLSNFESRKNKNKKK